MGGCDKTTPALLMGADLDGPAGDLHAGGPMLRGNWGGTVLGSGSDTWKYWAELRAGDITPRDWDEIEQGIARSPGHCMTMGTASTMTGAAEALGFTLPGASSIPAPGSRHAAMATLTGKRIVEMVWEDLKPSDLLTAASFDNAVTTVLALGGSTNAVVHLIAMARRAGVPLDLDRFDELARARPLLADIRPSGAFLMEDFYYAGGLPALLAQLGDLLKLEAPTVNGRTLGENIEGAKVFNDEVIRPLDRPWSLPTARPCCAATSPRRGGHQAARGRPAPAPACRAGGGVPGLQRHGGPDRRPGPAGRRELVLVLKNAGPLGAPGMPEWGQLPIPQKLLQQGVRDMVRISDARMSGTSYGACVLHVAPEAFVGGPLALVQDGDIIELDIPARKLTLRVGDEDLARRRAAWEPPPPPYQRGYGAIFAQHVTQANEGCDFDCLERGAPIPEPEIH